MANCSQEQRREALDIFKIISVLGSLSGEQSYEYDQRSMWEKLLRKPKRMKKVTYEVKMGKIHVNKLEYY